MLLGLLKETEGKQSRKERRGGGGGGGSDKDGEQGLEEVKYKAPPPPPSSQQHYQQQTNKNKNKKYHFNIKYFVIFTLISLLGILCHDEIYLFIIMVSVIPIIFGLPNKHFVYAGFLAAMAITLLVDRIYIENYFTSNLIFGIPLLVLSFLFVSLMWAFYVAKIVLFGNKSFDSLTRRISNNITNHKISFRINNKLVLFERLKNIVNSNSSSTVRDSLRITLAIAITFAVVYWYIFTFIFWVQIPPDVVTHPNFWSLS